MKIIDNLRALICRQFLSNTMKSIIEENTGLVGRVRYTGHKNAELTKTIGPLQEELRQLKDVAKKIEAERDDLKKLVREQTEADLLVNALKGLGIVEKEAGYDPFARQRELLKARQFATNNNSIGISRLTSGLSSAACQSRPGGAYGSNFLFPDIFGI